MNLKKNSRKYLTGLAAGLLALLFLPHANIPGLGGQRTAEAGFFSNDLQIFEEVMDLVSEKYVYPPDHKKLFTAAIEGMVKNADSVSTDKLLPIPL